MQILKTIDPEERRERERLARDCAEIHVLSPPQAEVKLEVFDANGEQKSLYHDFSRSWVRNAYNRMFTAGGSCVPSNYFDEPFGEGSLKFLDVSGNVWNHNTGIGVTERTDNTGGWSTEGMGFTVGAGGMSGVIVGSGDEAESLESYNLETVIQHGSNTGQLEYFASSPTVVWDSSNNVFIATLARAFVNSSGDEIGVNEVGVWLKFGGAAGQEALLIRDVLDSTVSVPDENILKAQYVITSPVFGGA